MSSSVTVAGRRTKGVTRVASLGDAHVQTRSDSLFFSFSSFQTPERTLVAAEDGVGAILDHRQHLVLVELLLLVREAALLNDERVEAQLHLRLFDNALLNSALGNESKDTDLGKADRANK